MESYTNIFTDEWHSLGRMLSDDEGSHQFAKQGLISTQCDLGLNYEIPNIFLSVSDESSNVDSFEHLVNASDDASIGTMSLSYPYDDSFSFCPSNIVLPLSNDVCDQSISFHMMDEINNSTLLATTQVFSDGSRYLTQDVAAEKVGMAFVSSVETPLKRKHETRDPPDAMDGEVNNQKTDHKNHKKRVRVSRENITNTNVQSKKNQQMINDTENANINNEERNGQSSSSSSSNADCDGSEDLNGARNTNGKTRASRGTATDPQSLYARKRRERINERLRILQNLVPNGTKVDISTMLEEAVEYVKFLKLQIQLLSSDDMWMYAPIAYNGMDMGLYQNIITPNVKI